MQRLLQRSLVLRIFWDSYQRSRLRPLVVHAQGKKRALICFVTQPFKRQDTSHASHDEVVLMASVLQQRGYAVDAVHFKSEHALAYHHYDLVIGFGNAFARAFDERAFQGQRILYLNTASLNYSNEAEARRAKALKLRRGVLVVPRRALYWEWMNAAINADGMILVGNRWTRSTVESLNDQLHLVPVPYVSPYTPTTSTRNWMAVRTHFLWFAGRGALHKGLDLLLEAFSRLGNSYTLEICGPISDEADFLALYAPELTTCPNILQTGFVDVTSAQMSAVLQRNAFVILPSCSEGSASSVVTCMAGGLLPVVTPTCGIDTDDFGFLIHSATVEGVMTAVQNAAQTPAIELATRSVCAMAKVQRAHSHQAYQDALSTALNEIQP